MICPVLHNPSAFDTKAYASRFLVDCDVPVPVVSYLRVGEQGESSYVSWKAVKKRKDGLAQLDARARQSLTERPNRKGWDPINIFHRSGQATIMRRIGDFFTASDMMDPEMMEILHNYFDAETVYVGIPHACFMVASTAPEYIFNDFYLAYDEAAAEGLQFFEQVFQVDNGHVTEIIDTMPIGPSPELKVIKGQGIAWFTSPYRGKFKHLEHAIRTDFRSFIPSYCGDPEFSGRVVFEIPEESPPFSNEEVGLLGNLEAMLNGVAREENWVTSGGDAVMVRIRFSQRVKTVSMLDSNALKKLKSAVRDRDRREQKERPGRRKVR